MAYKKSPVSFVKHKSSAIGYMAVGSSAHMHGNPDTPHPDPCLLYTSPSPRDRTRSRMPSSA